MVGLLCPNLKIFPKAEKSKSYSLIFMFHPKSIQPDDDQTHSDPKHLKPLTNANRPKNSNKNVILIFTDFTLFNKNSLEK